MATLVSCLVQGCGGAIPGPSGHSQPGMGTVTLRLYLPGPTPDASIPPEKRGAGARALPARGNGAYCANASIWLRDDDPAYEANTVAALDESESVSVAFYDVPPDDSYWVQVELEDSSGDDAGHSGTSALFTVAATGDTPVDVWCVDDYEYPGDDAQAGDNPQLGIGESQRRSFETDFQGSGPDEDWVIVSLEAGVDYTFYTHGLGPDSWGADTVLRLCDSGGNELAYNDDGGPESLSSRIDYSCPSTGDYWLQVVQYSDRTGGWYTLTAEEL